MSLSEAENGRISLGGAVVFVQSAIGVSMIAFGGFGWALDGGSLPPVAAVLRLPNRRCVRPAALPSGNRKTAAKRGCEIRLRNVTFAYPAGDSTASTVGTRVLNQFNLTVPAEEEPR